MAERVDLFRLTQVQRLREAQTQAAADQSLRALRELEAAEQRRNEGAEFRDAADTGWQRMLGETRPNPELVRLGAKWLLEKQHLLEADELGLAIAQSRRNQELQNHREAMAREAAVKKIGAKVRQTMARQREERQSSELTDSVLRRWCK